MNVRLHTYDDSKNAISDIPLITTGLTIIAIFITRLGWEGADIHHILGRQLRENRHKTDSPSSKSTPLLHHYPPPPTSTHQKITYLSGRSGGIFQVNKHH